LFSSELFSEAKGLLFLCREEKVVRGLRTCVREPRTENILGEGNIYIREGEKSTVEQIMPKDYYLL
jgi:hypothetical protein